MRKNEANRQAAQFNINTRHAAATFWCGMSRRHRGDMVINEGKIVVSNQATQRLQ